MMQKKNVGNPAIRMVTAVDRLKDVSRPGHPVVVPI